MTELFHHIRSPNFNAAKQLLHHLMKTKSHVVHPYKWQGIVVKDKPEFRSHELLNVSFTINLFGIEELDFWRNDIGPNLPWADDHFAERVCGYPLNPGTEWRNWPWGESAERFVDNGQFNHTYAERYWPKWAGMYHNRGTHEPSEFVHPELELTAWELDGAPPRKGIRNYYGDLHDLCDQLCIDPHSRQEWFPVFHPEDVGQVTGGRKPCSLGYQFIRRDDKMHIYYPLRSCDLIRHWADDCYLTIRLLLWVIEQCRLRDHDNWDHVKPGGYTMHMTSLHVFENDMRSL